ncbi:MAG: acetyl-CoA carboxylase biotin carboxyl carrier protein [Ktedonobacteraceae bacterium]
MDGNSQYPYDMEPFSSNEHVTNERISVVQLRHLVQLLDGSDVSEIEVKRAEEGIHLVLRKARMHVNEDAEVYQVQQGQAASSDAGAATETRHTIASSLVGIFHPWSRPNGSQRVSVGERVKIGQAVGMIQSLNVINEVETPFAGRIVEILVQDDQAVEYGQQLIIIDSSEEA